MRCQVQCGAEPARTVTEQALSDLVCKQEHWELAHDYDTTLMSMQGCEQQAKFKGQEDNWCWDPKPGSEIQKVRKQSGPVWVSVAGELASSGR